MIFSSVFNEIVTSDSQEGGYTFEILKSKDEAIEESDIVQEEIFEDNMEYVYEQENIISKEHSYPSNEIIELINFSEEIAIDESVDEQYPLIDEEIVTHDEEIENGEEIIINESSCCEEVCSEENETDKSVTEDLEVDAFFKTLAMKVKNAKLSQSLFTDLQIQLLQTIQHKLKNS